MRLLKPAIISAVIHGLPQTGCTENTCGKADLATIQNVFLCFKYKFYEMLSEANKSPVLLFSLLESPNLSIGKTADVQPHFTGERRRQPREAEGGRRNHTAGCGRAAAGGAGQDSSVNMHVCLPRCRLTSLFTRTPPVKTLHQHTEQRNTGLLLQ